MALTMRASILTFFNHCLFRHACFYAGIFTGHSLKWSNFLYIKKRCYVASPSRFAVWCVGITDMEMLCNSAQTLVQTNIPYCIQKKYCSRTCQQARFQTGTRLRAAWHWYSHTLLVFV